MKELASNTVQKAKWPRLRAQDSQAPRDVGCAVHCLMMILPTVILSHSCCLLGFLEGCRLYLVPSAHFCCCSFLLVWAITLICIFSEFSMETLRCLFSILDKLQLAICYAGKESSWLFMPGDMVSDTLQLSVTGLISSR